MKCEKCDNEATVHEVRITAGKRHETHLCEQCAKDQGLNVQTPTPITQLLTQFITSQAMGEEDIEAAAATGSSAIKSACPVCGTTYAQFRNSGVLGCEQCYATFEAQLAPLVARAHEGGASHVGKCPKHQPSPTPPAAVPAPTPAPRATPRKAAPATPTIAEQVATLRKALEDAVSKEQYEQAAKLRDELARLEGKAKTSRAKRAERSSGPPDVDGGHA